MFFNFFLPGEVFGNDATFGFQQSIVSHVAQIGISIEPLQTINQLSADPSVNPTTSQETFIDFATKTAENLFNYCSSFAQPLRQITSQLNPPNDQQFMPLSVVQQWYSNFTRRLQMNPNFWKN